ncbi:MAG TPA: anhydro-N-acetylmuramic acid kinase [Caulobacteraceae bacterium]
MRVLGFMSGTSLDAVDMAVVETDGERVLALGPAGERKLPEDLRRLSLEATARAQAWREGEPEPEVFAPLATAVAEFQAEAALAFLAANGLGPTDIDAAGFHGQTLLHERPSGGRRGRSIQVGDAALLARRLGVPVVYELRRADTEAGGQGAPLAPAYHAALAAFAGLRPPLAVLNLGGVGNLTFIDADGSLTAFDTGPANGPLDQWVERHGRGRFDEGGRLAAAGRADEARIAQWLARPYFERFGPKSLDRYEFTPDLVQDLSLEDGAATLAAFSAACIAHAVGQAPRAPERLIVCGGGRRNRAIMDELRRRVPTPVFTAEDAGWRGDSIEAEAWAFLAARSLKGLPITWPTTTGAPHPLTGGKVVEPC